MSGTGDEGSVTLFCCVASVGLLAMVGLVVDGGAKVRALERADRIAAEAGRAGGEAIDVPAAITGAVPVVDARRAVSTAQAFLAAQGVSGTATVEDGGRSLVVDVTSTVPTYFLGLVGLNTMTVHGSARVTLVRGVTEAHQ